ncbi:hypothetical protein O181_108402 [Austropuccinia psidii MF-1]|uniref:Uncharacterized protein n=1 Tax=Austropuccinia psidii MF-1 TaxID=1389203 RepID=A0A9Q3PQC9_9BASI|nr:hypothetical protein [Austropuccinia psidii MF-1]
MQKKDGTKVIRNLYFKVVDLILVSTLSFNDVRGPKKLKYSFSGPFMTKALHGRNAVQLELAGELMNKHPTSPVAPMRPYSSSDKELFTLRNKPSLEIPPLEEGEERKRKKKKGKTLSGIGTQPKMINNYLRNRLIILISY